MFCAKKRRLLSCFETSAAFGVNSGSEMSAILRYLSEA